MIGDGQTNWIRQIKLKIYIFEKKLQVLEKYLIILCFVLINEWTIYGDFIRNLTGGGCVSGSVCFEL